MLILVLMMVSLSAYAETKPAPAIRLNRDLGEAADGILGLVVNQTISTNGYEFYRMFYLLWSEKPDSLKYSLNVQEKLSKQRGNQVIVYLGQKVIFSGVLPLKYEQLKELSTKAAEETQANLVMLLLEPSKDADIDGDQV
jgi:hypothetical protein